MKVWIVVYLVQDDEQSCSVNEVEILREEPKYDNSIYNDWREVQVFEKEVPDAT